MRIFYALSVIFAIIGCTSNASIEFGMNDETLFDAGAGDLRMRALKIEVPDGDTYATVWEGIEYVQIELQTSDFISITNRYIDVEPRTYPRIRLTVDSLTHVQQTVSTLLIDSAFAFTAEAFTPIVVGDGDELKLVVTIGAEVWFDEVSVQIIPGHDPFESAALRIYYDYQ
jgi:hypothetical protein